MKKCFRRIIVGIVMLSISIFLTTTSNATFTMRMNLSSNENVKVGDEVIVTIGLTQKTVACNFEISYNKDIFEFIGSATSGLSASVNGDKISCIYYDATLTGIDTLKIKFKAKKETDKASNFSISGAKFREKGKDTSYTGSDIIGAEKVLTIESVAKEITESGSTDKSDEEQNKENNVIISGATGTETNVIDKTVNKTTNANDSNKSTTNANNSNKSTTNTKNSNKSTTNTIQTSTTNQAKLPNAGVKEKVGYILMAISILLILSAIFKAKEIELNKIFKAGGLMLVLAITTITSLGTIKTYAATESVEIKFYKNTLIQNQSNVIIALNNKTREIKKSEVKTYNTNITDIVKTNGTSLADTENVKTGDIVKVGNNEYTVILLGDSNSDGIICDTDDIMTIINDYLGINKLSGINRIAANLENNDNLVDTDDIMQMANTYLGRTNQIITTMPTGNIDETNASEGNIGTTHQKLVNVVQFGDKINYIAGENNIEWRVWKTDGTNVIIMPTTSIYKGTYGEYKLYWSVYEQNGSEIYNGTNEESRVHETAPTFWSKFKSCLNTTYAKAIRLPKNSEYSSYASTGNTNELDIFNRYFKGTYGSVYTHSDNTTTEIAATTDTNYWLYDNVPLDLRPVVILKDSIKTSGKDENGVWQLVNE